MAELEKKDFLEKYVPYRSLLREIDSQEKISYLKRELTIFVIFMFVFFFYAVSSRHIEASFLMQRAVASNLLEQKFPASTATGELNFVTFYDINDKISYFQWLDVVVRDNLMTPAIDNDGTVFSWNELLFGIRFRQQRVGLNSGCEVQEDVLASGLVADECAAQFDTTTQSTAAFGTAVVERELVENSTVSTNTTNGIVTSIVQVNVTRNVTLDDFTFSSTADANEYDGTLAIYPGDGFIVDFLIQGKTIDDFDTLMDDLFDRFVDTQTRAVFLTFPIYNVNFNLFMDCNLIVEFGASGYAVPGFTFEAAPLLPGTNSNPSGLTTACNWFVFFFILYFLYKLIIKELRHLRRIDPFWISIDITMVVLLLFHLIHFLSYQLLGSGQSALSLALKDNDAYYSIAATTHWYKRVQDIYAVTMVLICIRVFKYLKLSSGLSMVWKTLSRSMADIAYFFGLFSIMFIGFSFCAYLAYGPHLDDYVTFGASSSTLLRMILGEIDYAPLREVNPSLSWLFLFSYIGLFFFVLGAIFLAILLDAWNVESILEKRHQHSVDLWGSMKRAIVSNCQTFKRGWRKKQFWRSFCVTTVNVILNRQQNRGFMNDEMVLVKLKQWKKKRQNRNARFLTITDLKSALEGNPVLQEVPEAQLVQIFLRVERYLLSKEAVERMEAAGETDESKQVNPMEDPRDVHFNELKRLQATFMQLAETQRTTMNQLNSRMHALSSVQTDAAQRLDGLDDQVKKIVPHFADE